MLSHRVLEAVYVDQAAVESLWQTVYACIGCDHSDKQLSHQKDIDILSCMYAVCTSHGGNAP